MAKKCPITQKTGTIGGGYSNRTRATKYNPTGKTRKRTNIQKQKIFVPSMNKTVTVPITTKGLRILKKKGIEKGLREANII